MDLVLFDIDGTLLQGASIAHATAVHSSLESVFGVDVALEQIVAEQQSGVTASMLGRRLLADRQRDFSAERFRRWELTLIDDYRRVSRNLPAPVPFADTASAVRRLLDSPIRVGLLTGNFRDIARRKLVAAGVWDDRVDLSQGAFGDDGLERDTLGAIARTRARNAGFTGVAVVGDTPRDIAAARSAGALAIAVATGTYDRAELRHADHVLGSLTEVAELLLALTIPVQAA